MNNWGWPNAQALAGQPDFAAAQQAQAGLGAWQNAGAAVAGVAAAGAAAAGAVAAAAGYAGPGAMYNAPEYSEYTEQDAANWQAYQQQVASAQQSYLSVQPPWSGQQYQQYQQQLAAQQQQQIMAQWGTQVFPPDSVATQYTPETTNLQVPPPPPPPDQQQHQKPPPPSSSVPPPDQPAESAAVVSSPVKPPPASAAAAQVQTAVARESKQGQQPMPTNISAKEQEEIRQLQRADELFDKQFAAWEEQFAKWKEENRGTSDTQQLRSYEEEMLQMKNKLLTRRDQLRHRLAQKLAKARGEEPPPDVPALDGTPAAAHGPGGGGPGPNRQRHGEPEETYRGGSRGPSQGHEDWGRPGPRDGESFGGDEYDTERHRGGRDGFEEGFGRGRGDRGRFMDHGDDFGGRGRGRGDRGRFDERAERHEPEYGDGRGRFDEHEELEGAPGRGGGRGRWDSPDRGGGAGGYGRGGPRGGFDDPGDGFGRGRGRGRGGWDGPDEGRPWDEGSEFPGRGGPRGRFGEPGPRGRGGRGSMDGPDGGRGGFDGPGGGRGGFDGSGGGRGGFDGPGGGRGGFDGPGGRPWEELGDGFGRGRGRGRGGAPWDGRPPPLSAGNPYDEYADPGERYGEGPGAGGRGWPERGRGGAPRARGRGRGGYNGSDPYDPTAELDGEGEPWGPDGGPPPDHMHQRGGGEEPYDPFKLAFGDRVGDGGHAASRGPPGSRGASTQRDDAHAVIDYGHQNAMEVVSKYETPTGLEPPAELRNAVESVYAAFKRQARDASAGGASGPQSDTLTSALGALQNAGLISGQNAELLAAQHRPTPPPPPQLLSGSRMSYERNPDGFGLGPSHPDGYADPGSRLPPRRWSRSPSPRSRSPRSRRSRSPRWRGSPGRRRRSRSRSPPPGRGWDRSPGRRGRYDSPRGSYGRGESPPRRGRWSPPRDRDRDSRGRMPPYHDEHDRRGPFDEHDRRPPFDEHDRRPFGDRPDMGPHADRRRDLPPDMDRRRDRGPEADRKRDMDRGRDSDMRRDVDRRSEHGDRRGGRSGGGPPPPPALSGGPQEPEPAFPTVNIMDLLQPPGRHSRPANIIIVLRGLPGSGKTYTAKLIKDQEMANKGSAPRILSLDDYFCTEKEKKVPDPVTGKTVTKKVMEYEYDADLEEAYRTSLNKVFRKTIDDGFFHFVILDCVNARTAHYDAMCSYGAARGFKVYVAQMDMDEVACHKRNIHGRSLAEVRTVLSYWEPTPPHLVRVDIRALLQADSIQEVEMEDTPAESNDPEPQPPGGLHKAPSGPGSSWGRSDDTSRRTARPPPPLPPRDVDDRIPFPPSQMAAQQATPTLPQKIPLPPENIPTPPQKTSIPPQKISTPPQKIPTPPQKTSVPAQKTPTPPQKSQPKPPLPPAPQLAGAQNSQPPLPPPVPPQDVDDRTARPQTTNGGDRADGPQTEPPKQATSSSASKEPATPSEDPPTAAAPKQTKPANIPDRNAENTGPGKKPEAEAPPAGGWQPVEGRSQQQRGRWTAPQQYHQQQQHQQQQQQQQQLQLPPPLMQPMRWGGQIRLTGRGRGRWNQPRGNRPW